MLLTRRGRWRWFICRGLHLVRWMPPHVVEPSKYNCKSSLSWEDVCTWTNYEWKLLWKCWGLLYSWVRKSVLCCCFMAWFVLFLSVHPDSCPLWIFCEPALVCSAGKVLWSFVSPHQCHRYLFLNFLLASCYCRICFQSVLAPATSFPAEINIVPPALGFHWQQCTVVWDEMERKLWILHTWKELQVN